ncbi:MAG: GntR family transcriptional regulator [Pirellulales bacterium]|nr:GntR family transcriptional regulator [Pirellulales bacterium]
MPLSETSEESTVYDRLLKLVFSGDRPPGKRLIERELAKELGVSRIPVRESIREMLAQGLLVGGDKWKGACTRFYTPDEIRQLSEYRQILEGGAARLAARHANRADLTRLEKICQQALDNMRDFSWTLQDRLDHHFHDTLAAASRNERLIHTMQHLLTESYYVFYVLPSSSLKLKSPDEITAHLERVWEDHRSILDLIRNADAKNAERLAIAHLQVTGRQSARDLLDT